MRVSLAYIVLAITIGFSSAAAQSTRVRGRVVDSSNGQPIPLVSVLFEGTTVGMSTDFDGCFSLETNDSTTVLRFDILGYSSHVERVRRGAYNELNIKLTPQHFEVQTITITPGTNPALLLLGRVAAARKRNDPDYYPSYSCKVYTKMEIDATNIDRNQFTDRIREQWDFMFDKIDTSVVTGKRFLPIMLTESTADYHYRRSPRLSREVIVASRMSGIKEDYSFAQFTGQLHVNVNLYNNYINLFNVSFASPLSTQGELFYRYFLVDSLSTNNSKSYKIRFHPRGVSTPVLDGEIDIDSATCALRSAKITMAKGVNVNWLHHLNYEVENQPQNDTLWFKKSDKLFVDVSLTENESLNLLSLYAQRETFYSDFDYKAPIPIEVERMTTNVVIDSRVLEKGDNYWQQTRPVELREREKDIYNMVDSVKSTRLYRNIYRFFNALFGGYYQTGKAEWGPYYNLVSYNKLERVRLQVGGRTLPEWSHRLRLSGYVAYGTGDHQWKYGGGAEVVFERQPLRKLTVSGKHDVMQLGAGGNALSQGNVMGSLLSRGGIDKLGMVDDVVIYYKHQIVEGIDLTLSTRALKIHSSPFVPFVDPEGRRVASTAASTVGLGLRFSHNEMVMHQYFDKYDLYSDYPVVSLSVNTAIKGLMPNDCHYWRTEGSVDYSFNVAPIGRSHLVVGGGKIWGRVPYPLLKIHEGNGTYFYDPRAFSCMNYYEFAADTWCDLFFEHHFGGFLFGKIPLLKKLNWREVFVLKMAYGQISATNDGSQDVCNALLRFPVGMSALRKPYVETGVGIENIFNLIRVDAVWRLTHRQGVNSEHIDRFALNISFRFAF